MSRKQKDAAVAQSVVRRIGNYCLCRPFKSMDTTF